MENNKNIWLLPTNEPSRLYFDVATKELMLQKKLSFNATSFPIEKRNIYITNDETIKEGDWFLDDDRLSKFSNNGKPIWVLRQCTHIRNGWIFYDEKESEGCNPIWSKKIILTDNQDLINDGVQPIPDEFLEWFVKNPSCESVDVDYRYDTNLQPILDSFGNKVLRIKIPTESENLSQIIIPKEEPLYDYGWCKGNVILPKEEPKQDWYCPKCNSYVSAESVTFEETHQICNTSVIVKEEPKTGSITECLKKLIEIIKSK
jgi:hypothetical protein